MFEQYLQEIGLSEKESRIYLALLQVDRNTVQELANRTKINRTTVYPVLESLQKKGLVSEIQEGKKVEFMAEPPERLETYAERQRVVFEEHAARLKDIIPQIKSIQREQGERPVVKYFEGRDGAISAYEEFYGFSGSETKTGYYILNSDLLSAVFTEKEMDKFREMRKGKKVSTKVIYNNKDGDRIFGENLVAVRIDYAKFPITCDIAIIEDEVIISTLGHQISSVLIKSADIAQTLISLIEYIEKIEKGSMRQ